MFALPFWWRKGLAQSKAKIFPLTDLDYEHMPINKDLLEYLKEKKAAGHRLLLVTASPQGPAEKIARRVGIFDEVYGSSKTVNLKGRNKAHFLNKKFGEKNYIYVGDSQADLHVWKTSASAVLVNPSKKVRKEAESLTKIDKVIENNPSKFKAMLEASHYQRYVKNLLIFLPLAFAFSHHWRLWLLTIIGFVAFCCASSFCYIVNDLLDLKIDRQTKFKRHRVFASGALGIPTGLKLAACFLIASFVIASFLNWRFIGVIAAYIILNLAYSFFLKDAKQPKNGTKLLLIVCRILAGAYII
jgi:hypothetical protein